MKNMKKIVSICLALVLALSLCAALPAAAADGYSQVLISDGYMAVAFSQARTETKTILLGRQNWVPESAEFAQTAPERKEINLIVVGSDCVVTRTGGSGAMSFSFLSRNGSEYLVAADRLELYNLSFSAATLLSWPFVKTEIALLTLNDGTEYYIVSGGTAVTEAPPLPISYEVQPGDSLETIALNYYGAQGLGEALKAANPAYFAETGGELYAWRTLTLPTTLNGVTLRKTPLLSAGEQFYTIKSGDTLAGIALKHLGDAGAYTRIIARNPEVIKDASTMLRVGTLIILPAA